MILWRMVYERMLFQLKSVTDVCELHNTKVSSMLCEFCVTDVVLIVNQELIIPIHRIIQKA